jgi:uncharacterized lipoprotein YbaY
VNRAILKAVAALAASVAAFALAGCASLDMDSEGNPNRLITGTVNFRSDVSLPPDARVSVRVVDNDSGSLPMVLGFVDVASPGAPPIPFRLEFSADDARMRHGLNLQVRVAYGGQVHFANIEQYVVTLGNEQDPHRIWVDAAGH